MICLLISFWTLFWVSAQARTIVNDLSESKQSVQYKFKQLQDMELFQIDQSPQLSSAMYLLLEITIDQNDMKIILGEGGIMPILCFAYDSDPTVISSSITSGNIAQFPQGFDENQYYRDNGFYSLMVDLKELQKYSYLVLGVFIHNQKIEFSVNIRVRFASALNDICPFDCNQGLSTSENCQNRSCICPSNKIDYDCSQSATLISNTTNQIQIFSDKITYAYYQPTNPITSWEDAKNIQIYFEIEDTSSTIVEIYIYFEGMSPKKILPTTQIYSKQYSILDGGSIVTLQPDQLYDSGNLHRKYIIFGLKLITQASEIEQSCELIISLKQEGSNKMGVSMIVLFSLMTIGVLIFLIWMIIKIIKSRNSRFNRVFSQSPGLTQIMGQDSDSANGNQYVILTTIQLLGFLESVMPALAYEDILQKFKENNSKNNNTKQSKIEYQDACSVCLSNFQESDICRETICGHCFHKDCLEHWLIDKENCPFCRADLSVSGILKKSSYYGQYEKKLQKLSTIISNYQSQPSGSSLIPIV